MTRKTEWLPMPDDFTPLDGSSDEPPVAASHAVDVWFRMGRSSGNPKPAGAWHWRIYRTQMRD
jgi:hypothetical protein